MNMSRFFRLFLVLMLLFPSFALAGTDDEASITAVLYGAGISEPVQLSQWGDTAACFAETEGVKRLILLEKHSDAWQIVIDNPTALLQDADWPELYLDSDRSIYWTYILSSQTVVRYHSYLNADGRWSPVDQFHGNSGFGEYTHIWNTSWDGLNGGEITRAFSISDENDNDRGLEVMQILPASWLADCIWLADFDVSRFPTMFIASNDCFAFENERFFREAAKALMPEYMFIKGMLKNGAMHFLMEKPDGSRVYVICEYMSHRAVNLIESSPLPDGTVLGHENFTDSLWIGGRCVTVQLYYSGKAGLEYIYDDAAYSDASGGFLFFGERAVWDGSSAPAQSILYGAHPWSDITQMVWDMLPHTLTEASARMDSGDYAVVVNPDPADRLHLREQADRGSRSQGKYYTGTPVGVSAQDGDWTQVIFGDWRSWVHGYMMRRYLTFGRPGSALRLDTAAMPQLTSEFAILKVYEKPQAGSYTTIRQDAMMLVIGVVGDEWYHVWFPATGQYGFVRQNDLTAGNG